MTFAKASATITTIALLSACSSQETTSGPLTVGPGATLSEAEAAFAALGADVTAIETAQGITNFGDVQRGTVTYTGIIGGAPTASPGPGVGGMTYVADLTFTSDLPSKDLMGTITNVVTDEPGFENPSGGMALSGSILNTPEAAIGVSGSSTLTQGGVEVDWVVSNMTGFMVGTDGGAMMGTHSADFTVTAGSLSSDSFAAEGSFYAVRD